MTVLKTIVGYPRKVLIILLPITLMFIYTKHAKSRTDFRGIKEEWVEHAITKPTRLKAAKAGRKQAILKLNGEIISVIYVKEEKNYVIVTVFWGE